MDNCETVAETGPLSRWRALAAVTAFVGISYASSAPATLVVAVPTNDGLVVVADSRAVATGKDHLGQETRATYDSVMKLRVVDRVVFALAGRCQLLAPRQPGISLESWLSSQQFFIDGFAGVAAALRALDLKADPMNPGFLRMLAQVLAWTIRGYFALGESCHLATFQVIDGRLLVGAAVAEVIDLNGGTDSGVIKFLEIKPDDRVAPEMWGMVNHAKRVLQTAPLPARARALWDEPGTVSATSEMDGRCLAVAIVRAAEAGVESIGGRLRGYLITPGGIRPIDSDLTESSALICEPAHACE